MEDKAEDIREQTGRLNSFLYVVMVFGAIRSVTGMAANSFEYTIHNEKYFSVFLIIGTLGVVIHIVSIVIILWKKNIVGLYLFVGNLILLGIITPIITNEVTIYPVFSDSMMVWNGVNVVVALLFLLLKADGRNAYEVLSENKKKISINVDTSKWAVYLLYGLVAIVVVCCIVAVATFF